MKKRRLWMALACLLVLAAVVCVFLLTRPEEPPVTEANSENMGTLLTDLANACETPSDDADARIAAMQTASILELPSGAMQGMMPSGPARPANS